MAYLNLKTAACAAGVLACLAAMPLRADSVKITSDTFGALQARALGPATPSGRIAAVDAWPDDPLTIYAGAASGGVWKSTDAGVTFKAVFDEHTQSIGAIRIDPTDKKTVWVGTGESWARNSTSVGDGIYKSTDGGDTWNNLGLKDTERIARIQVDAKNHDTVFVCATGHLWNGNEERGVFRTSDGGKTWKKVLYVDADTGCSDLAIDPQDGKTLYAGMWQFRRSPDFFSSGGKGSGLYKTTDGGDTWVKLEKGLPAGDKGRIGIAIAPSRPSTLYAVVESKKTAVYRSDDTGLSWTSVNDGFNIAVRPFYFALLAVDPQDYNTVYKPGFFLTVSNDGGKTFTNPLSSLSFGGVHPDHHAFWINPKNANEMLLGTDGGLYISYDKAKKWLWMKNLPVAQFYHVSYDMQVPYNVFGGLQDNGSWEGPSQSAGGIEGRDWNNVGGGDGFWVQADAKDPNFLYSESQGGNLSRVNLKTSELRDIKPYAKEGEKELRFNWNAPIVTSPNDIGTIYLGSQFLYRSHDRGETWERISPDLTTNDPKRQRQAQSGGINVDNSSAENNTTIYSIAESPKNHDVIWAGTDDGNVQVTRDGGKSWTNVTANLPNVPKFAWVSSVHASPHAEGTAFATIDNHRSGDMSIYVFKTTDFGKTWTSLVTPELKGYAWILRDDPVNPDLLYLGTEQGLWLTLDGGKQWARFTGNLPPVAVHDVQIHPRDNDLIIATHGRGIYIVDDVTPIRALTQKTLDADVAILPSKPGQMQIQAGLQNFSGDDEYTGFNPPEAASITYWLKKRHLFGDLKVEVYDAAGKLITTIPGSKRVGINRVMWPMRLDAPKVPPSTNLAGFAQGPIVPEGTYKVKLIKGKDSYLSEVKLVADPRSTQKPEDRKLQQTTALKLYYDIEDLSYIVETANAQKDAAKQRAEKLGKDPLAAKAKKTAETLESFVGSLVATSEAGWLSGDEKLKEKLVTVFSGVNQYEGRPTGSQMERIAILEKELQGASAKYAGLTKDVAALNAELAKKKVDPLPTPTKEEWKAKSKPGAAGSSTEQSEEQLEFFSRHPVAVPTFHLSW